MSLLSVELRLLAWLMLAWLAFMLAAESIEVGVWPGLTLALTRAWVRWRRRRRWRLLEGGEVACL